MKDNITLEQAVVGILLQDLGRDKGISDDDDRLFTEIFSKVEIDRAKMQVLNMSREQKLDVVSKEIACRDMVEYFKRLTVREVNELAARFT